MQSYLIAARFVHFAAVTLLFGAWVFPLYAGDSGARLLDRSKLRPWFIAAAGLSFFSALVWWDAAAATMSGSWAGAGDSQILGIVLFQTEFGRVWLGRLIFGLGLFVALLSWRGSQATRASQLLVAVGAGLLTVSLAGVGHAVMLSGMSGGMLVIVQALHALSAGVWVGGLIPLALAVRQARAAKDDAAIDDLAFVLRRFSSMGTIAVGVIVLTGFLSALLIMHDMSGLTSTGYGGVLLAKLLMVLVMIAVAADNRWRLSWRVADKGVGSRDAVETLKFNLILEIGLGVAILAIVSLLGTIPPPSTPA